MVSSVIKRKILGIDHGIIVISEGVFHVISNDELLNCGIEFSKDEHGHPELGNISKGQVFNTLLVRRLKELGIKFKSHPADIGFEMRCASPIASDLSFCTSLGLGVYKLFQAGYSDCMVSISTTGDFVALKLGELENQGTDKLRVRLLDFESEVVRETYDYIFHYLVEDDYDAAKKYLPHPEEYDFNKIIAS
jgi:6-phosphofructokinase 1